VVDAVVPEVRGDVPLAVPPGLGVDALKQVLHRTDDRLADPLHDAGVADREWGRGHPSGDDDDHRCGEQPEPDPAVVGPSRVDVVEVDQYPRREHERHVDHDEDQKPDEHEKVQGAAVWMLKTLLMALKRVDSAGDIPRPVIRASGAARKTVVKYAISCRPL